ncbi:tyrosine-type recombinase/integrase [Longivirga aurantiaca]|uniref:Tyrosine-type recombinase/integrase n=1 Tax=Longivirga aurantiaca TaxID=1837743 RepID=A0ABW1T0Q5_9ACTN
MQATSGTRFEDRRDHAMISLLLDGGLRISEPANLQVVDVDLDVFDAVPVTGKGGKARAVQFDAKAGKALERYLRERRSNKAAGTTEALWLGQRGALSFWGVEERLKVRAAQAGVENLRAHRFRHTVAADVL